MEDNRFLSVCRVCLEASAVNSDKVCSECEREVRTVRKGSSAIVIQSLDDILNPERLKDLGVEVIELPTDPEEKMKIIQKVYEEHIAKTEKRFFFDEISVESRR